MNASSRVMLGQGELDECFVQATLSFLRTACHYFSPRARGFNLAGHEITFGEFRVPYGGSFACAIYVFSMPCSRIAQRKRCVYAVAS